MLSQDLPGWTCPALDRLSETVRRHVPDPERTDSLIRIEGLRVAHVQLRALANRASPDRAAAEVARLEQRVRALELGREAEPLPPEDP